MRYLNKCIEYLRPAIDSGVIALKACLEYLGNDDTEVRLLGQIAKSAGIEFGIKIGGPTATYDARLAREFGADFMIAPIIESPYTASIGADLAKIAEARYEGMLETQTAMKNPETWSALSDNAKCIIFGTSDLIASGGNMKQIKLPYEYLVHKGMTLAIGGAITAKKAISLKKEFPEIDFIETRHCRIYADCLKLGEAVDIALRFESIFYSLIGKDDVADRILKRIGK